MSNRTLVIIVGLLAVLALALFGLVAFIFFFAATEPAPPTPVVDGPVEVATAPVDDSLARVQAAGKIVVGTAADYPPFEYYVSDFQLDGFDIALMNEIAQRLGVQPEYQNFAFDGLGSALELGQIDVAIAAISVTPERAALVDFSNIYYVTLDAILAGDQSQVTISQVQDLAGSRVGVQSGSVHADWAQTNLVASGLIPPSNLLVYQQIDQAVGDLQAGRLDFVVLDLPPAQAAVQAGGVTIVGQGLNEQRFALALRKGSTSLKTEIDRIVGALYSEGRVAELAKQYLDLEPDELLPTPTPTPTPEPDATATPLPTPAVCLDGLALVEHLSLDDNNMSVPPELQPGQAFTKGWRVQNTGTCTWDTSYRLIFSHGSDPAARMGGEPVAVTREVPPGDSYDIQVNLVAPLKPGTYQAFWQMINGQNVAFGERLRIGIRVPAPPTATPAPTQTPAPGIDFRVDRTNIKQGECVTFSWNVENVREVYFYPQGADWRKHGVAGQASQVECPSVTTTYELRVIKQDGSVEIRQITVNVEPVTDAPFIARFTVDPEPAITVGQCVDIRWEVRGQVDKVKLTANNATLWDGAPTSGSLQDCPPGAGTVEYALEATGPGGSSRQVRTIRVLEPATAEPATPAPPTSTPAPEAPVIQAFEARPNQVEVGGCVDVSWRTGGGTSRVQIRRDGNVVLDNAPIEGSERDCSSSQPAVVVYRLEAFNNAGQSVSQEVTVSVNEAPPQNPLANTSWSLDGAIPDTNVTASFAADGRLNGSAGCNSYSTQYLVDGQNLSIGPPASSQSLCAEPEGIMEQEAAFISALPQAATFEIRDGQLFISDGSGSTILTFNQLVATPF